MNKRGINHIEVMLSFLIFVGFVIFALYFFSPFKDSRLAESSTSYALSEITKNASVELDIYSVSMDVTDTGSGNPIKKIKIENIGSNPNIIVRIENRKGEEVQSKRDVASSNINFDSSSVHEGDPTKGFALFKFSEDFKEGSLSGGEQLDNDKYKITASETKKIISEKRILALNYSYYNDYETLRKQFNLPARINFGFAIQFDSGDIIESQKKIPKGTNIFSDIKRVEVLREIGNVVFAELIVRIW